ncbi:hypothetical protein SASPL_101758 [Salvia splendens]|uniref:Hexosyltransferase n=1 Tax=Salvia splendens TaxID=180675 RepID=A0A8X8YSF0_SALSN|nr:hypothetical protein SASPL_101758 [Salvia splendens]
MLRLRLIPYTLTISAIIVFMFFIVSSIKYTSNPTTKIQASPPPFTLLIGILTRPDSYDRRHFLRLIYATRTQSTATFTITVKYDYVMKTDDDVYLRLEQLATSLSPLPRQDLYYGFVIPCQSMNPFVHYMSGMGFVLSWDLVEWIGASLIPLNHTVGPEDKLVGEWLNRGNKAKNRVSNKPAMYDYPRTNGRCSHDLVLDTIAVHRLKRWEQWLDVLTFFNVTNQVKPSTLYTL